MAGQNGYITSAFDGTLPNQEFGEAIGECDLVGYKADAGGRKVLFKALAAAGGTQVAAVAINPEAHVAGGYEAIRANTYRVALPATPPAVLSSMAPGDPVYLSDLTAGAMTKTIPVGAGKIAQRVGTAYYTSDLRRGMPVGGFANGILVDIKPLVQL